MPSHVPGAPDPFHRIGNHLAIDFANTRYSPDHTDGSLRSARDVLAFLAASGAMTNSQMADARSGFADSSSADRFLKRSLQLRDAVTEAIEAIEQRRSVNEDSLRVLNDALRADEGYEVVERLGKARYKIAYRRTRSDARYILAPIARATAALLIMESPPVRKCASTTCIRHFYDDSRTRRRRWCDMAACGSRAKMAAFLERRRRKSVKA